MIDLRKLKIYVDYDGDLDLWTRMNIGNEQNLIQDGDWYLIDQLLEDALVLRKSAGKGDRAAEAMRRLQQNSENEEVVAQIRRLAGKI